MYQEIEDHFECSGMCRPSLFYFGVSIDEGFPQKTCLMQFKKYLDTHASDFGYTSGITAILCLWLWLLHFALYFRQTDEYFDTLESGEVEMNNRHINYRPQDLRESSISEDYNIEKEKIRDMNRNPDCIDESIDFEIVD